MGFSVILELVARERSSATQGGGELHFRVRSREGPIGGRITGPAYHG